MRTEAGARGRDRKRTEAGAQRKRTEAGLRGRAIESDRCGDAGAQRKRRMWGRGCAIESDGGERACRGHDRMRTEAGQSERRRGRGGAIESERGGGAGAL